MNEPNGTGQTPKSERPKPTYYNLCYFYALNYDDMLRIAERAKVTKEVIDDMFLGNPVKRSDACSVLKVFSDTVGTTWTIDTVRVPVLPEPKPERTGPRPSLLDLWTLYQFQPRVLAILASVPDKVVDDMICCHPVTRNDAKRVLDKLSTIIRQECTLETVSVPLLEEERHE
jgi:hypothetical protein